jgi:peroxiredoxin
MRFWPFRLAGLAVVLAWLVSCRAYAQIREGDPAPAVELPATQIEKALPDQVNAKTLRLADLQGKKNVVLYFFPKAMTPG